jgi:hypothetical protein
LKDFKLFVIYNGCNGGFIIHTGAGATEIFTIVIKMISSIQRIKAPENTPKRE